MRRSKSIVEEVTLLDRPQAAGGTITFQFNGLGVGGFVARGNFRDQKGRTICLLSAGKWSEREDSNLRPPAPEAGALPGCATLRPWSATSPSAARMQEQRTAFLPHIFRANKPLIGYGRNHTSTAAIRPHPPRPRRGPADARPAWSDPTARRAWRGRPSLAPAHGLRRRRLRRTRT